MKLNNEQLKERLEEREVINQHIEWYRHIIYEALEIAKNQEMRDRFENEQDYNEFMKSVEIEREFCENLFAAMKKLYEGEQIWWDSHARFLLNTVFMVVGMSILYPACLDEMEAMVKNIGEKYKTIWETDGAVAVLKRAGVTLP
jgi:hypothetical protein